jgi:hypothetical protein
MASKLTVENGVITFTEELETAEPFYPTAGDMYYTPTLGVRGCEACVWEASVVDYERQVGGRVFRHAEQADAMQSFIMRLISFALN